MFLRYNELTRILTIFIFAQKYFQMVIIDIHHHHEPGYFGGSTSTSATQTGGNQGNAWVYGNQTAPSFTPPAPAEAAAAWANHASVANDKAQDALRDIMQIRTDAANRVNSLHSQAQQTMDQIEALRASTLNNLKNDSTVVYNNYVAAKQEVVKMLHAAQKQALAAKELATNTSDAVREQQLAQKMSVQASSFADKESKVDDSPGDKPPPVDDSKVTEPQQTEEQRDIENILKMIRQYTASKVGATKTVAAVDDLAEISKQASSGSAKQSSEELRQSWAEKSAKAQDQLKHSAKDGDVKAFMARLSEGTLLYDTAAAVSAALKSAKDLGDTLVQKELDAEKQILGLLRDAQQSTIDAANEASKAEMIAMKAANFTQQMADQAKYAQNAAGQAMAAQMAQALGFSVTPQPTASPFMTLPPLTQAGILDLSSTILLLAGNSGKARSLSNLI